MGRDITQCHPRLQEAAAQLVKKCRAQGLNVKIGESFRSKEEQDALYAQGRTKPGNIVTNAPGSSYSSMHQWGVAFDFFKNVSGHEYDDTSFFNRVGAIGKSLGLEWGGDWTSPVDKPHLQLADWGSTPSKLKKLYGNFDNFKKTWEEVKVEWKAAGIKVCIQNDVTVEKTPGGAKTGTLNAGNLVEVDGAEESGYTHVGFPALGIYGWVPDASLTEYLEWKGTGVKICLEDGVAVSIVPGGVQIGTLNGGDMVETDGSSKDGCTHVALPAIGVYGWVPDGTVEEWKATGVMAGAANDINIRSAPGGTILGQLQKGGLIEVDGKLRGEWIHVGIPSLGIYGWMQGNLTEYTG